MKFRTTKPALAFLVASIAICRAGDEKITLSEAPAAVRKAISEQTGSNKLVKLEKADEDGQIQYEALTQKPNGKKIEFVFKVDGTLDSTEEPISPAELPSPIADQVKTAVNGAPLKAVERVTRDGTVTYEVAYKSDHGDREAVISSAGKILKNGPDTD